MYTYLKCAWVNIYTRAGFACVVFFILASVLHLKGWDTVSWYLGVFLLGVTSAGTQTMRAYKKTIELYRQYGRNDQRYLGLMEKNAAYCTRAGVRLATAEIAAGKIT